MALALLECLMVQLQHCGVLGRTILFINGIDGIYA